MSNITNAVFDGSRRKAITCPLFQYDYGQILKISGVELPASYQVQFSNTEDGGISKTMLGDADGVQIPDEYLLTGEYIYAFIFLHEGTDDGETEYVIEIPVIRRPVPSEETPTPAEQSLIDQLLEQLNQGVEAAEAAADQAGQAAADAVAEMIDDTLTIQGKAADAKATGDEITQLKSDLNDLTEVQITETSGYFATNGSISTASATNQEVYTNRIRVNSGDKLHIKVTYPTALKRWVGYGLYTPSGAWISRTILISDSQGQTYESDVVIPDGAGYIAFTYRTFGYENVAQVMTLTNLFMSVRTNSDNLEIVTRWIEDVADLGKTLSATDLQQGEWVNGAITSTTSRLCTKVLYPVTSGMTVNYNTSANLNIAIRIFDKNGVQIESSVWLGGTDSAETYIVRTNGYMGLVFKRTSGSYISTNNYSTWGAVTNIQNSLSGMVEALAKQDTNKNGLTIGKVENVLKPMYDHLFVNSGENAVIPHESLYHVRISKRLGFNVIEVNLAKTSDDVYVVNHFNNGAFGTYFHHVDGTTDIRNTLVSSVTWDWIVENVRYNSTIPKYRTRPSRLEEFLAECKQQGLVPLVMMPNQSVLDIAESYMGHDNYIAYGGTRALCPTAVIFQWQNLASKDAILKYCRGIGTPLIYGMSNVGNFTESELREIVTALHNEGFWIGTSYADASWYRYSNVGFDIIGTQRMINRIDRGNKYNIDSMFGFSGYIYTNAEESDGVLTFNADGTISPDIPNDAITVGGIDLQIVFDGEITIPAFGELSSMTYTRDASIPIFVTTPLINKSQKITLQVKAGTVIYDCTYRVIKC